MRAALLIFVGAALGLAQISPPSGSTAPQTYQVSTVPSGNGVVMAASATDFWCIQGSASKTVFVTSIIVTGQSSGSAITARINLVIRSTANTGGTSTTLTAGPLDSGNAGATATVLSYTANPTLGNLVGVVKGYVSVTEGTATNIIPGPILGFSEQWGTARGVQPLTLRGTAQEACLNLGASSVLTNFMVSVEWYEQ